MTCLKYFFKPMAKYLEIPTTTIFPSGKFIWNIGNHNPFLKQGFVLVCCSYPDLYKINPNTLEAVFVGGYKNAKILSDAADCCVIGISNISDMEAYIQEPIKTANHTEEHIDNMKEAIAIVKHFSEVRENE